MPLSILVIGAENPRVADLFREVAHHATVYYINIGPMPRRDLPLSAESADSICTNIRSQFPNLDVIVFTWPHLACLAERLPDFTRVYYCKDPFEQWTCWDRQEIRHLESRLLHNCDATFAVSRQLVEDFQPRTRGKVFYLPNGVEDSFLNAPNSPRPANLPTGKPILGSIGHINATYDWQYIAELAASLPEARLVFVGGISESNPTWRRDFRSLVNRTPNLLFLDHQPHDQLPAYLQHFDISICYLIPDESGHRRSPLRLYDYLTTQKPIISTPIREAHEHLPHIHIAKTAREATALAQQILSGDLPVNTLARRQYIEAQTWPTRATQFLAELLPLQTVRQRSFTQR